MAISALLFDCDGVLADTEPDGHRVAFNAAFKEKGSRTTGPWTSTASSWRRAAARRMTAHWDAPAGPRATLAATTDGRQELHLRKTAIFNELIEAGSIPLRAGVLRLIDEALADGVPVGVCSTSSEQAVRNLVRVLMGRERYDALQIFAGDVVANKKPAPDVYLLAATTMGLEPARCVVIEDSSIGLAAAKAAGMKCIITKSSYADRRDFTIADEVVDDAKRAASTSKAKAAG
ncbi:pseudouridine 5'-phosphatase [Aureococcus anophagefferens]|nr:pseudouridine 5'-phosphatase [Aureococcus anophagefferens]